MTTHRFLLLGCLALASACGGIDDSGAATTSGTAGTTTGTGGGTATSTCADTWASYGASFFSTNCRSCHTHTADFATQSSVQTQASRISAVINSGSMPEGSTLSATDKARVLAYLSCGAL